jgi:hypothetical protein
VSTYDRRRRRKSSTRGRVVFAVVLVAVFVIGVALGEALHDSPRPSSTITQDETFTLPPAPATVTVTTP